MGCNYLSLPLIPASGSQVLIDNQTKPNQTKPNQTICMLWRLRFIPANTQRNIYVIITSKLRFDVIIPCLLHWVFVGIISPVEADIPVWHRHPVILLTVSCNLPVSEFWWDSAVSGFLKKENAGHKSHEIERVKMRCYFRPANTFATHFCCSEFWTTPVYLNHHWISAKI